jgi:N-acetylmuramoyl-L-alanine amidase
MKKWCLVIFLIAAGFLATSFSPKFKPAFAIKTIVIDPGHGGKDPGCHGTKYKEKDVALAVSLKLGKYIEEHMKDVKVIYTRKTDVFVELQERANIANKAKADLFICIHCNSACVRDKKLKRDVCKEEVHGAETYVMGIKNEQGKLDVAKRENSAILLEDNYVQKYDGFDPNSDESYIIMSMFTDTYLEQSLSFASKLQKQYKTKSGRLDKGVKRASLWVLWRTYMPSVLTEIGYLTNPEEEQFLGSVKGQEYIASSIFRAFREYKDEVEGAVRKYEDEFEKQAAYKMTREDSLALASAKNNPVKGGDTLPKDGGISKTPVEDENQATAGSEVVYKVQIASSDKRIPLTSDKFTGVEKPGEYVDKGIYKYTAGEFRTAQDAARLQASLRKSGYKDAFVIAMKDGKRIPLK